MVTWFLFGVFTGILIMLLLLMVLPFFAIWVNRLQGWLLMKLGKGLIEKASKTAQDIGSLYKEIEQLKTENNGRAAVNK